MALDFTAGCLGGMAGVVVGHPLDTVKVNLQTQSKQRYRGTLHCITEIFKAGGTRGLYRGITSPLYGVSAINALIFGVYGITERALNSKQLSSHFIAGSLAGLVQSPVCSITELIKIQLQVMPKPVGNKNHNFIGLLKSIHATYGLRNGLLKALPVTVCREIPAFGSYFLTYEFLTSSRDNPNVSTLQMLIAGGLAGQVSWILSYPVDVIKTRLQTDLARKEYSSVIDCIAKTYKCEGVQGFWKGLTPTLIRAFPTNAACFCVVNWTFQAYSRLQTAEKNTSSNVTEHKIETMWISRDNVL